MLRHPDPREKRLSLSAAWQRARMPAPPWSGHPARILTGPSSFLKSHHFPAQIRISDAEALLIRYGAHRAPPQSNMQSPAAACDGEPPLAPVMGKSRQRCPDHRGAGILPAMPMRQRGTALARCRVICNWTWQVPLQSPVPKSRPCSGEAHGVFLGELEHIAGAGCDGGGGVGEFLTVELDRAGGDELLAQFAVGFVDAEGGREGVGG